MRNKIRKRFKKTITRMRTMIGLKKTNEIECRGTKLKEIFFFKKSN